MVNSITPAAIMSPCANALIALTLMLLAQTATAEHEWEELVILNWSDYMNPELVQAFEAQHNIKIKEVYYASDDDRDDILQDTNGHGYDIAIVSGAMMKAYIKRGWLTPIDDTHIPNLRHIDLQWKDIFPEATQYGVPYFWGTLGIAYRSDHVDRAPTRWMDLFKPQAALDQRIVMIDASRELIGMALKALGYSANSVDRGELKAAEALLIAQAPHVKSYGYIDVDEESALLSGDISAAMAYNGDALALHNHNENIRYVVPEEGSNLWIDYLTVLKNSKNRAMAMTFINFINEPKNAAKQADFVFFATPNKTAEQYLSKDFLNNELIYPSQSIIEKSEFFTPLLPRAVKRRNEIFSRVVK